MEGVSANVYRGIKRCWSRRGYQRIYGTGRRRINRAELGKEGAGSGRKKRSWRIKITRKLRFSPKKFFVGLRDAYVNFMLRIANTRAINSGFGGGSVDVGGYGGGGFGKRPLKEYDEKVLVEIYKTLIAAQGQLVVPRDAGRFANQIASGR